MWIITAWPGDLGYRNAPKTLYKRRLLFARKGRITVSNFLHVFADQNSQEPGPPRASTCTPSARHRHNGDSALRTWRFAPLRRRLDQKLAPARINLILAKRVSDRVGGAKHEVPLAPNARAAQADANLAVYMSFYRVGGAQRRVEAPSLFPMSRRTREGARRRMRISAKVCYY